MYKKAKAGETIITSWGVQLIVTRVTNNYIVCDTNAASHIIKHGNYEILTFLNKRSMMMEQ